jgi:restriction system protein
VSTSTIPQPPGFFHAILRVLVKNPEGVQRGDIFEEVANLLHLTQEQRAERLPAGAHFRYRHRIGWSLNMLKVAGYAEPPSRGIWRATARGLELLAAHPSHFSDALLRSITKEARNVIPGGESEDNLTEHPVSSTQQSPEERIGAAVREIEEAVARELLERISQAPPVFFEELVLELLHALGYGTSEADLVRLGGAGDAGLDGCISLDKLGLEKVYIQAKRWQGSVGRPEVQAFLGALAGQRAKKGVFITTSYFTREARDYRTQVSERLILIDGTKLTALMIEYGVGVTHFRTIRLPKVDGDYFE